MYRKMIFVTGAVAVPLLAAGCIPSHSSRAARWEMPSAMDDVKSSDPASPRDESKPTGSTAQAGTNGDGQEPRSRERGRTVRHLPASCDSFAYANVKALQELGPISANEAAIRDRVRAILDEHKDIGAALAQGLEALHAKDLYWRRDLEEASACFDKERLRLLVVAGSFEGSDLIQALRGWATRAGGSAAIVDRAGHSYAMIGRYYAAQIAPGMVAVSTEMDAIDAAHADGPGLVARGGAENALALVRARNQAGRDVTSSVARIGDDTLVVNTSIDKAEGTFDSARDRGPLRERVERVTEALRDSPLSPLADDVARTDIVFAGNSARMRTVIAEADLRDGIAKAASSGADAWRGLYERWVPALGVAPAPAQPPPVKISAPAPKEEPASPREEIKESPEPAEAPAAEPDNGAERDDPSPQHGDKGVEPPSP